MATTGAVTARLLELEKSITFRSWRMDDRMQLVPLIVKYLEEACPDMVPSEQNAWVFFDMAGKASLVATTKEGEVVGFTLLAPIKHIETKVKMMHSVGTYVVPSLRRRGIAERLRRMAMVIARNDGVKMLQGYTYSREKAEGILRLGGKVVGMVLETPLDQE